MGRGRDTHAAMRFEKWQALGNDYLIVEARRAAVRAHAGARARALRAATSGVGADGVLLLLASPTSPASSRALRIFNPDGSEAELSGNGAREAILYLRRARLDRRRRRSRSRPRPARSARRSPGPTTCTVDMGRAQPALEGLSRRRRRRQRRRSSAGGREWRFQHVSIGNPQCAIRVADPSELDGARPAGARPADRAPRAVPQPHQRLAGTPSSSPARDPRADLRARGGGDAVLRHRRQRRRRRRTSCAAATRPVTVRARRRRARGRGRGGPAREPDRLGGPGVPRRRWPTSFVKELHATE